MLKAAMVKIGQEIVSGDIRLVLTVHDELVFEIKKRRAKEAAPRIKKIMENVIQLKVPVVVDIKQGRNWGEMKELRFG
jgi:DNA polymerase-1